jgi:hypothetical protein
MGLMNYVVDRTEPGFMTGSVKDPKALVTFLICIATLL